jgi:hypothetical protein
MAGPELAVGSYSSYVNTFFECKEGVSIGFLTILLLGVVTMWYLLYTKITKGRRRRSEPVAAWAEAAEFLQALAFSGESEVSSAGQSCRIWVNSHFERESGLPGCSSCGTPAPGQGGAAGSAGCLGQGARVPGCQGTRVPGY